MASAESSAHLASAACVVWHLPGGPADAHVPTLLASLRKRAASVCVCADRFAAMAHGLRLARQNVSVPGAELVVVLVDGSRLVGERALRVTLPPYVPGTRFLAFAVNDAGRPTLTRLEPMEGEGEASGGPETQTPPKQIAPGGRDSRGASGKTNPVASGPRMDAGGRSVNLRQQAQPRLRLAGTSEDDKALHDDGHGSAEFIPTAPASGGSASSAASATGAAGAASVSGAAGGDDDRPGDLLTPEEWAMLLGDEPGAPPTQPPGAPPKGPDATDDRGGGEASGARVGGMR